MVPRPQPPDVSGYPELPADTQRAGDPAKGYDYLVNGGYITCGIPRSAYDRVFGASDPGIPGRTGANATLPYNYSAATSKEGVPVVSANCLTCHAGTINGQLVVGLGAADGDFTGNQAQYIDAAGSLDHRSDREGRVQALRRAHRRGRAVLEDARRSASTRPTTLTAALFAHRDPTTLAWSDTPLLDAPPKVVAPVDVPPWWRMKKKHAMFYTAAGRGDHARIMMAASLLCTDSVDEARAIDAAFVDVRAWIETLDAPKWPFADRRAARRAGQAGVRDDVLAVPRHVRRRRHVSEPARPRSTTSAPIRCSPPAAPSSRRAFVQWFATSFWGETSQLAPQQGYVAPPLDGIWATAPFFHNGSVPTIAARARQREAPDVLGAHVVRLDRLRSRPRVGWNFTAIDARPGRRADRDRAREDLRHDAPGLRQHRPPVRRRTLERYRASRGDRVPEDVMMSSDAPG